jgi:YD repeat-containing protein
MNPMKILTLCILISNFILSAETLADINMMNGSLVKSWQDAPFLKRTYRSRTLYSGYFGYGWCSNLEKQLQTTPNGDLILKDCELESEILLLKTGPKTWKFQDQMQVTKFPNGNLNLRRFSHGTLHKSELDQWTFNPAGQMLAHNTKWLYKYDHQQLQRIRRTDGASWKITWDDDGQRITMISGEQLNLKYNYRQDDLASAVTAEKNFYQYDSVHNLTSFRNETGSLAEEIDYDRNKDRVTSQKSFLGCTRIFKYLKISKSHYRTVAEKHCRRKAIETIQYDFWQRALPLGSYVLEKMKVKTSQESKEFAFDPTTGESRIIINLRIGETRD